MDNNNNTSALVPSTDDKNDNCQDRQFTKTADFAARGITRTQRFIKSHYRGILMGVGAATALGVLYAIRRNNDDTADADAEASVEYEFDNDSADTDAVDTAPMSNNTL